MRPPPSAQILPRPALGLHRTRAIQAANIVNSATATEVSVHVVRAFGRQRQLLVNHKALAAKLTELDSRVGAHDEQIGALFAAIRATHHAHQSRAWPQDRLSPRQPLTCDAGLHLVITRGG